MKGSRRSAADALRRFRLDTSYHQFSLAPAGRSPVPDFRTDDQLIDLVDGTALVVAVGVRDGYVEVTLTCDPDEDWGPVEDEAQAVLMVTEALWLTSPTASNDLDEVFTPDHPGLHHVRVRAHGRGRRYDESVEGTKPVEWYQIALWPAD